MQYPNNLRQVYVRYTASIERFSKILMNVSEILLSSSNIYALN